MNKKNKKLGVLAKVENNFFSTTNYIKPITPSVNMSLNSRDFSIKGLIATVGVGFAGHAGIQYIRHKSYGRSLAAALLFAGIEAAIEAKDYWLDNKKCQRKVGSIQQEEIYTDDPEENEDEEESRWEDLNDATYGHREEKLEFLPGEMAAVGGTLLIYGPKSQGKTAFVTTLIDHISKGEPLPLFPELYRVQDSYEKQEVYLYDLEMRYCLISERNGKYGYSFDGIKRNTKQRYTVQSWLSDVEGLVNNLDGNTTVVIDNITRLDSDINQPTVGKKLFDGIRRLQKKAEKKGFKLTVILVAHTSNDYVEKNPLTLKELAAADTLTTGIETIMAIGPTKNKKEHLIKITNHRNGVIPDEVAITQIVEKPYLRHEVVRYAMEGEVLPKRTKASEDTTSEEVTLTRKNNPCPFSWEDKQEMAEMAKGGSSYRDIAEAFTSKGKKISHTSVQKYIQEIEKTEAESKES